MRRILGVISGLIVLILLGAWLWLRGPDIPFETLEAKYAAADSHFVDLPGGYHVHYREDGDPNAPLLVLLHGFADSFTTWDGWVRELQAAVPHHQPGFSRSRLNPRAGRQSLKRR